MHVSEQPRRLAQVEAASVRELAQGAAVLDERLVGEEAGGLGLRGRADGAGGAAVRLHLGHVARVTLALQLERAAGPVARTATRR